jgi:hypothetical protein
VLAQATVVVEALDRDSDPRRTTMEFLRRRKWMEQVYKSFTPEKRLPMDDRLEVFSRGIGR